MNKLIAELRIIAHPGSSKESVSLKDGCVHVWVRAAAHEGKANEAICALLAAQLRIPKSRIAITHGTAGKQKRIEVQGMLTEDVFTALFGQHS